MAVPQFLKNLRIGVGFQSGGSLAAHFVVGIEANVPAGVWQALEYARKHGTLVICTDFPKLFCD